MSASRMTLSVSRILTHASSRTWSAMGSTTAQITRMSSTARAIPRARRHWEAAQEVEREQEQDQDQDQDWERATLSGGRRARQAEERRRVVCGTG